MSTQPSDDGYYADADYDDNWCEHICDENCDDGCYHEHICSCGACGCAGYCDDYITYNLRPSETGGAPDASP